MRNVFSGEQGAFSLDERGGVHRKIDPAFSGTLVAAIAADVQKAQLGADRADTSPSTAPSTKRDASVSTIPPPMRGR